MVKGEKTKCIREAIQALGLNANRSQVQVWLKQKYGFKPDDVAESTFYNIRRAMIDTPVQLQTTTPGEKEAFQELHDTLVDLQTNGPKPKDSVASIVRQLKQVVERLGKNEVKELIDVL